jgi:metallo-beta-lactamase class B
MVPSHHQSKTGQLSSHANREASTAAGQPPAHTDSVPLAHSTSKRECRQLPLAHRRPSENVDKFRKAVQDPPPMRIILAAFFSCLLFATTAGAQGNPDWHREFPGFRVASNLYHVGTADLAVYLIATPKGHIIINSDFKQDLPLVKKNIEQLGFAYKDIEIVLISHAHGDHDEAIGVIARETGAKVMVMEGDVPEAQSTAPGRPGARVDRVLRDGDTVELGGSKLVARLTAGHTPGCTTWTLQLQEGGKTLNAVIIGSPNVNPGYILVGNKDYPSIADDYKKTFALLESLPCDLFLGAHGSYFSMLAKHPKLKAGAANPFIDPEGYKAYVAERKSAFQQELARQQNGGGPKRK